MPAFRVIPCLDVHGGRVVKGVRFVDLREVGDPVALAHRYREEGADELVFLDISATVEERAALRGVVAEVAEVLDIPFAVGGGVRSEGDAAALLLAGADKVSVNTAAVESPELIGRLASRFGSQCVVLAIDARTTGAGGGWPVAGDHEEAADKALDSGRHRPPVPGPRPRLSPEGTGRHRPPTAGHRPRRSFEVVTHAGRRPTGRDAAAWAAEGAARGAGEILLTSMDRDGTGLGFDLDLLAAVRRAVPVPLVASGGGETAADFVAAARAGADAGLAASIFHEARVAIGALKRDLAAAGVEVRLEAR